MEEIAQVYSRALFEAAQDSDKLDVVCEQVGAFADALNENREMSVFFFSPYFSTEEKKDGIGKLVDDADERFVRFLELLAERHRMPVLFRMRREFEALYAQERKLLPVTITSAVELDEGTVKRIGDEIQDRTGKRIELTTSVDPDVIGGLSMQVGNVIMDATIRARLERLRKEVAKAA